jgi:TPP-dependent indolepyruvate ferredoxin oxidoreductase alpha subunit
VLAAAAVIGFHAEIDVLAAVSGQPLTALDECLAAGMLHDGGADVVFRHELAREAVAASHAPRTAARCTGPPTRRYAPRPNRTTGGWRTMPPSRATAPA